MIRAMKPKQQALSIDLSDKKYYQKIIPKKPILTSHDAGWQNLVFEHHHQWGFARQINFPETFFWL